MSEESGLKKFLEQVLEYAKSWDHYPDLAVALHDLPRDDDPAAWTRAMNTLHRFVLAAGPEAPWVRQTLLLMESVRKGQEPTRCCMDCANWVQGVLEGFNIVMRFPEQGPAGGCYLNPPVLYGMHGQNPVFGPIVTMGSYGCRHFVAREKTWTPGIPLQMEDVQEKVQKAQAASRLIVPGRQ